MGYRENTAANWQHIIANTALMLLAFAGMIAAARGVPFGMRIVMLTTLSSFAYTSFVRARQVGHWQRLDERDSLLPVKA